MQNHICWYKLCNIRQRQFILGMTHYHQKIRIVEDLNKHRASHIIIWLIHCKVVGQQMEMDRRYSKTHYFHFPHVHLVIWCQDMPSPRGKEQTLVVSYLKINHIWKRRWLRGRLMFRHWAATEGLKRMHINCFSLSILSDTYATYVIYRSPDE